MTAETDAEFVERVDLDLDLNNTADIQRLVALARRRAAADAIVKAAMQGIDHVSRFNSPERTTEARAMVRKAAGEPSDE